MTDRELRRLNRRDLLRILVEQVKETEKSKLELEEVTARLEELDQNYERLRKRLDQKDLRIHELTDILQAERTKREIELREAGSIAEAALRLNGVFEAAQKAADQYLYNIRFPNKEKSTGDSKNEPGGIQEDTGERYEGKEER